MEKSELTTFGEELIEKLKDFFTKEGFEKAEINLTQVASYAALPPDVRKVSDFPFRGSLILRLRRLPRGAASQVFKANISEKPSFSAHQAAKPHNWQLGLI